jgi:hypothetical protein
MNDYVYVIVMPEKRIPRGMSKIGHLLLKKGQNNIHGKPGSSKARAFTT